MTRRIFVTRANGEPAHINAPPRLRQSMVDTDRKLKTHLEQWREVGRQVREPVELTDDPTGAASDLAKAQDRFITGVCFVSMAAMLFFGLYVILP